VVLRERGRRGSPESGELARVRGRERARKGSPLPKGLISGLGRVGERAYEGACRRPATADAARPPPAKLRRGRAYARHWRLRRILVKEASVSHGCGKKLEGELSSGGVHGARRTEHGSKEQRSDSGAREEG
jgi:hypothetical protein